MAQASFKFESDASNGGDQFTVVSFKGEEAISTIYRYEIEIKAPTFASINLDEILDSSVKFITIIGDQAYPVHGVLSSLNEKKTVQDYVYYDAVLVPRLWYLSTYRNNDIYPGSAITIKSVIDTVLSNSLINSSSDFDLSGIDDSHLLERDYICQFGESDLDFISRLIENEGIFYYFEQDGGVEKIIFINDLNYDSISGPEEVMFGDEGVDNRINAWNCRKQRLAHEVRLRDYNHEQPSDNISSTIAIDPLGQGTDYCYGDNISDSNEVAYLSQIRAEESLCMQTCYYGKSNVGRLRAGYQFKLDYVTNPSYDDSRYLLTELSCEGQDLDMTESGVVGQATPRYSNSFVAIEAEKQFRPSRTTPKPRFYGTMTAFIHADQANNNIEINQKGYYRVSLPFDQSSGSVNDRSDPTRKLSAWMRMAQPYAGTDEGLYYPLKGGTEVLLTFINGDPDRPIISAALPNEITPSLLTSANSTESILQTKGPLIEQIGITNTTTLPLPVFSQLVVDKPDTIKDKCDEPTLHPDTNPPMHGIHIDGHTNIQSKGSFVVHAQTQCEDESTKLTASHNDAFTAPSNDTFIQANPAKIENPAVDLKKIKFEMLEDRVILDAGNRDLLIKCNHFDVENVSEINDTVGHDHSTHNGSAYNEFFGESEEHYHGTKSESFEGKLGLNEGRGKLNGTTTNTDITETFTDCNITETYTSGHNKTTFEKFATSEDYYFGNKFEFTFSSVEAINTGHVIEMYGGFKEELALANSFDLFVGLKEEISLAVNMEVMVGAQIGVTLAGFLKATGGCGIDRTAARINQEDITLKNSKAYVVAHAIGFVKEGQSVKAGTLGLINRALNIFA